MKVTDEKALSKSLFVLEKKDGYDSSEEE